MRVSVDAVVVVRRGGEQLETTLKALAEQTKPLDRLVVVDASADSTLPAQIDAALQGASVQLQTLTVPYGTVFCRGRG